MGHKFFMFPFVFNRYSSKKCFKELKHFENNPFLSRFYFSFASIGLTLFLRPRYKITTTLSYSNSVMKDIIQIKFFFNPFLNNIHSVSLLFGALFFSVQNL